jgi:DNA-binding NtrC family response regulator
MVMRILVVDSDRDSSDLVYHVLHSAGYEALQSEDVADALRLSHQCPDIGVVIVDMRLDHQVSGMQMAGAMRQSLHHSHYILTSGDWDALNRVCPHDMSVLRKPYGKTDLLHAVRHGVARRLASFSHLAFASRRQQHTDLLLA